MTQPLIVGPLATLAVDYGCEFDCTSDYNPARPLIRGRIVLVQALYRRYITPRGRLIYDLNYGTDLHQFLDDAMGPGDLVRKSQAVAAEARKDDRVVDCTCSSAYTASTRVLQFFTIVTDGAGPFPLTLSVSNVTGVILQPPP